MIEVKIYKYKKPCNFISTNPIFHYVLTETYAANLLLNLLLQDDTKLYLDGESKLSIQTVETPVAEMSMCVAMPRKRRVKLFVKRFHTMNPTKAAKVLAPKFTFTYMI